jgi:ParB-like chromosome segregation protein Spo0J
MKGEPAAGIDVPLSEFRESLSAVRLCSPEAQQEMQRSLSKLGQLTPVQTYRSERSLELIDGFKRVRAAQQLSWPSLRAEVQAVDRAGAKVRLWRCNASAGLSELEESWLIRSLYRDDQLTQPQIAMLLQHHKSWVCRRLTLAEGLCDELTASVRLGLVSASACLELGRLPRCNQPQAMQVAVRCGMTKRQTARLVDALLAAPPGEWSELLEKLPLPSQPKGGARRRTPGENLVADSWAMKRIAARLHARLLERSLASLGEPACAVVGRELAELRSTLCALAATLDRRLSTEGASDAA